SSMEGIVEFLDEQERNDCMLRLMQREVSEWVARNFDPNRPSWHPLLGIQEEVGELSHAFLKRAQGIRGTAEQHTEGIKDALADAIIYMLDFCNKEGIDLQAELERTWDKVKQRDWKKNPDKPLEGQI